MKIEYTKYNHMNSLSRVKNTLDTIDEVYKESNTIPNRNTLTDQNGFYVNITVLHVDIRKSKKLFDNNSYAVLSKIYRLYISEVMAVLKGNKNICEVGIEGDGIWAVFDASLNNHVEDVLQTAGQISSLIDILNIKFSKRKYPKLTIGIGIDSGKSLYMKTGYTSTDFNEVVWIGKVFGKAAKYSDYGNREIDDKELMISKLVYNSLIDEYKELFIWNENRSCYHGNLINQDMNTWVELNR